MIKKVIISLILIYMIIIPNTFATDEIISSQMDEINISSFIKEGEEYTKEVFPDISLKDLLSSATNGKINNNKIFNGILMLFGDEIISSISFIRNYFDNYSNT